MYLGRLVEVAETAELFGAPHHPYTQALLSAAPVPDPERKRTRIVLGGDVPGPRTFRLAVIFIRAARSCATFAAPTSPNFATVAANHAAACHFAAPFPIGAAV